MNVAVFGGSFNPPHIAHVLSCALVLSLHEVDRIVVVPTFRHPFGKPLLDFDERVHMCSLAFAPLPAVQVSRVEEQLGGESRTLRTLEHLLAEHPDWKLRLMIGSDILTEAPRWFGFEAIAKLAPPIVLGRAGAGTAAAARALLPEVSSTQVREAIARGAWDEAASVLPYRVLLHIRERGLYGAPA